MAAMAIEKLAVGEVHSLVLLAQKGDKKARDRVVRAFLPLVETAVRRLGVARRSDRDDIVQEGVLGLLQGIDHFREGKLVFPYYVLFWIKAVIFKYLQNSPIVTVKGKHVFASVGVRVNGTRKALALAGRFLTDEELSKASNISSDEVALLRAAIKCPFTQTHVRDGGDFNTREPWDMALEHEDPTEKYVEAIAREEVMRAVKQVGGRGGAILLARMRGATLEQIGEETGVSRERIRQVEERAVSDLQRKLGVRSSWELK